MERLHKAWDTAGGLPDNFETAPNGEMTHLVGLQGGAVAIAGKGHRLPGEDLHIEKVGSRR